MGRVEAKLGGGRGERGRERRRRGREGRRRRREGARRGGGAAQAGAALLSQVREKYFLFSQSSNVSFARTAARNSALKSTHFSLLFVSFASVLLVCFLSAAIP